VVAVADSILTIVEETIDSSTDSDEVALVHDFRVLLLTITFAQV
jgi:hypothetical protein